MFMLHGRTQSMIGVEVIWQLPEWLVDHPQVYTYADGMLAASYPQSEAIAHLLHGTGTTELDNTTSSFLASNVQNESNAWARCWLDSNRKSRSSPWSPWSPSSLLLTPDSALQLLHLYTRYHGRFSYSTT